jgi:hypothetical protein
MKWNYNICGSHTLILLTGISLFIDVSAHKKGHDEDSRSFISCIVYDEYQLKILLHLLSMPASIIVVVVVEVDLK